MRHAIVEFQHEFSPSINTTLNFKHFRVFSNYEVPLIRPDGTFADSFSANQFHLNARFSWDERVNRGVFEKTYIFTRYPIISVDLLAGIKGLTSDDCSLYRGELTFDWRIPVGVMGYGNLHINSGAILGSVPYPLLKLHEGNETRFLDKSGFSLMNYYEFASDKWVTAYYEHNFNGLVLGNIPLIKKLNLREVVTFRGAWGTLSEQNRTQAPFILPEGMTSLEKPYAEAGVGITNIFRLGLFEDPYLDPEESANFVGNDEFREEGLKAQLFIALQAVFHRAVQKVLQVEAHIGLVLPVNHDDVPRHERKRIRVELEHIRPHEHPLAQVLENGMGFQHVVNKKLLLAGVVGRGLFATFAKAVVPALVQSRMEELRREDAGNFFQVFGEEVE